MLYLSHKVKQTKSTADRREEMGMKVGQVFYSKQKDSEWLIWHEITAIEGNVVTLANYGKDTDEFESRFYKKEINYCLRHGLLFPA